MSKNNPIRVGVSSVFCLLLVVVAGCGGGSSNSGQSSVPTASVTVQGPQSSTVLLGQTAQFTAMVQSISNTSVTWQVDSIAGGNATVGTISNTGLYTAPAVIPDPNQIEITAVSVANPSLSGSTSFTLSSNIVVTITPKTASVIAGQTQEFTANVQNAFNLGVTWLLNGSQPLCRFGDDCIDATGLTALFLSAGRRDCHSHRRVGRRSIKIRVGHSNSHSPRNGVNKPSGSNRLRRE